MDSNEVAQDGGAVDCARDFSVWLQAFWHIMQRFWQRLLVGIALFMLESLSHWNKQSLRLPSSLCTLEILHFFGTQSCLII